MALAVEANPPAARSSPTEEAVRAAVDAVRAGDLGQFDFLVEWHRDQVYRMAWRVAQDQESALDITQEVFVRVYRGLGGWKAGSKFSTWLYRIVMNTAIDVMRQEARHRRHQTPLLDEHLATIPETRPGMNPRQVAVRNELRRRVFEAVTHLSPKQRACFTMRHYQDLSLLEIAAVLGCSEGAVKKHLARAVERLRQRMGVL
jgi:RNA polymerase sigma-70 factor (ECF subfamily)